ncbi:MAG: hypothetical protein HRU48_22810 [Vibrio sp.]|uniref:hypothetical protein n=1 Tax=Vibrio sp. TaxID=678 RepID=UPI001EC01C26|nr:hypothetical protein [Vibrio sp.]NRB70143.1 hypothetical protein [Vibrio sp.]
MLDAETQNEVTIIDADLPVEAVAAVAEDKAEAEGMPQPEAKADQAETTDTESTESESPKGEPDLEKARAEAIKRQQKRKAEQEQQKAEAAARKEKAELQARVKKLEAGPEPQYHDFDDESDYKKALIEWHTANQVEQHQEEVQQPQQVAYDTEAETRNIAAEEQLSKQHKGYYADKQKFDDEIKSMNADPEFINAAINKIAHDSKAFDPAKFRTAAANFPDVMEALGKMMSDPNVNQFDYMNFMSKSANRVKFRSNKPTGKPTPQITQSGGSSAGDLSEYGSLS